MYAQDLFIKYYDYRPFNNTFFNKVLGNGSKCLAFFASKILPWYFKRRKYMETYKKRIADGDPVIDAIISMTSFPTRLPYVWLVLETLIRQTLLPKTIVLYLSKEQFSTHNLPSNLIPYIKVGLLQVRWVDNDIRSHKKYWYSVSEFPDSDIITVDDDIVYPSTLLAELYAQSKKHPGCVINNWWTQLNWDKDGKILPYSKWKLIDKTYGKPRCDLFIGSGGGTLFPKGSLKDAQQPQEEIMSVCPLADDIWLNAIIQKNHCKVAGLKKINSVMEWRIKHNSSLNSINNGEQRNDKQLLAVIDYFERRFGINPFSKELK